MSAQKDHPDRPCNWYVEDERIVSSNSNKEWILTSRKDNVREILVFPREHKTNKELISSEPF
jgi:hypothetical protein